MQYKTVNEYDLKIAELRVQLKGVQGSVCEQYSRIVGYYRNIENWNPGKKAEFAMRVNFKFNQDDIGGFDK